MSTSRLDAMRGGLQSRGTSHLLVIRNDKVVYEWYAAGQSRTTKHYSASSVKALVGGVSLGVAIDDGLISLDDPATKYVPQWIGDSRKSQIKIRHLGSHMSGIDDAAIHGLPRDQLTGWQGDFWKRLAVPNDPFTISRDKAPVLSAPRTSERYSNPGVAMLTYCVTASLRNAPVKDVRSLLRDRIMRPIAAPDAEWDIGYGQTFTVDGLPLVPSWGGGNYSPNASARIARLMLKKGTWEGRQLMSAATVQAITTDGEAGRRTAQGWRTNSDGAAGNLPAEAFWAAGAGHQIVLVVPSLNLIAVRYGEDLDPATSASDWDAPVRTWFFNPLIASVTSAGRPALAAPYPPSSVITNVSWASPWTIVRKALGSDTWPLTWADDDAMYGAFADGTGFDTVTPKLSLGFAKITGPASAFDGVNIRAATGEQLGDGPTGKKASGMLMVDSTLYMWTRNADLSGNQSQLAWSSDHGATWAWSGWKFAEFGYPTFVNFGKNYAGARDSYVYAVSHDNASAYAPADRFILMRVPKHRIRDRAAYEFFKNRDASGDPVWTADIAKRGSVFTFAGRCRRSGISYNAPLRRYLWWQMVHEDGVDHRFAGGFGIYDAPEPWGPWTTTYFTTKWDMGPGETGSFPTKWMSTDGKTVSLVFSGNDTFAVRHATLSVREPIRRR
jgi:CubicO group peptidase (beta-lactamase class C family)